MALTLVSLGFEYFPDFTTGRPVFNGSIFVGEPDTDPAIPINQKTVTLRQESGDTVDVAQPIATSSGGVPTFNGSPAQILADGNYSIKVLNSAGAQVYFVANFFNGVPLTSTSIISSSLINYEADNNFTGGVDRTQENKNTDLISVLDFGSPGNGTDDDLAAWQAALDHADSTGGGTVIVPSGHIWRLSAPVTIHESCSLIREGYAPIQRDMGTSKFSLDGVVYTDARGVTLREGASVEGLTFINNNLTYPVTDTTDFSDEGAFIRELAHDTEVQNCNFFGYITAIKADSSNTEKLTISDVKFDCVSGIDINQSLDVCRITNCHGWPYLTVATGVAANNYRAGTGFKAQNSPDQIEFVNCFAFHYENDFAAVDVNNATFIGCQADGDGNDATVRTTRGFHITGDSKRVRLIGCSAFSTGTPYTFASTANIGFQGVTMVGCIAWGGGQTGAPAVVLADGDLLMSGCNISDWDYAVWRQGDANTVLVDGCSFQSAGIAVFGQDASTVLGGGWVIGDNTYRNNLTIAAGGSVVPLTPVIVSATTAAVPIFASFMSVTGTTTINSIDAAEVPPYVPFTLIFDSTITLTVSGNLNLAGNISKTFASGDTLTLVRTAIDFREVSRSEN